MKWLLDTVTLSETRKRQGDANVRHWLAHHEDSEIYVSCISFGEIERGIVKAAVSNPPFAITLRAWLDATIARFDDRALPFDTAAARAWGVLTARLGRDDVDVQIAATALVHGLTVVTRNVRHFADTGVAVHNPWEAN